MQEFWGLSFSYEGIPNAYPQTLGPTDLFEAQHTMQLVISALPFPPTSNSFTPFFSPCDSSELQETWVIYIFIRVQGFHRLSQTPVSRSSVFNFHYPHGFLGSQEKVVQLWLKAMDQVVFSKKVLVQKLPSLRKQANRILLVHGYQAKIQKDLVAQSAPQVGSDWSLD